MKKFKKSLSLAPFALSLSKGMMIFALHGSPLRQAQGERCLKQLFFTLRASQAALNHSDVFFPALHRQDDISQQNHQRQSIGYPDIQGIAAHVEKFTHLADRDHLFHPAGIAFALQNLDPGTHQQGQTKIDLECQEHGQQRN